MPIFTAAKDEKYFIQVYPVDKSINVHISNIIYRSIILVQSKIYKINSYPGFFDYSILCKLALTVTISLKTRKEMELDSVIKVLTQHLKTENNVFSDII